MTTLTDSAIQARFTTVDGLRIRYADSGEDKAGHALLFNPWPESLFAFHRIWPRLAEQAHLVAVDLPGFGHSAGRESLMTPRDMGRFVVRVADEFGLDNPHVVGPTSSPARRSSRLSTTQGASAASSWAAGAQLHRSSAAC